MRSCTVPCSPRIRTSAPSKWAMLEVRGSSQGPAVNEQPYDHPTRLRLLGLTARIVDRQLQDPCVYLAASHSRVHTGPILRSSRDTACPAGVLTDW
jgi:hypothetical protein